MPNEINEIRIVRKKFGLTQAELAKKSGVSQSLVAKIESGAIDPSFSNVRKIFDFLSTLQKERGLKAGDVMHPLLISTEPSSSIKSAVAKMKKHGISQLPVIMKCKCVGLVSEAAILNSIFDRNVEKVEDVMEDAPPIVSKNTSVEAVSELLKHTPIVLVSEKGRLNGIVTKSDIISKLSDYRKT